MEVSVTAGQEPVCPADSVRVWIAPAIVKTTTAVSNLEARHRRAPHPFLHPTAPFFSRPSRDRDCFKSFASLPQHRPGTGSRNAGPEMAGRTPCFELVSPSRKLQHKQLQTHEDEDSPSALPVPTLREKDLFQSASERRQCSLDEAGPAYRGHKHASRRRRSRPLT